MPFSFDTLTPYTTIVAALRDTTPTGAGAHIQKVYEGVPQSYTNRISAFVSIGPQMIVPKATELWQREQRYMIGLVYKVAASESQAEEDLAIALDDIVNWFLATDHKFGGTVETSQLDFGIARSPRYEVSAGLEIRTYPLEIVCVQRRTNIP
jgi:hypothetical protein